MAKKTTFKGKSEKDLRTLLSEKRAALRGFRFAIAGSKARNVKEGKNIRKEIARICTEINLQKAAK